MENEPNKQYYKVDLGRPQKFDSPEELAEKANDYFKWCMDNPFKREEIVKYRDTHTKDTVEVMRPFTLEALCIHLGIVRNTFKNYEEREDFLTVTRAIRQIIDNQQFEGAASGFLNPNIIARKLGLRDTNDLNVGIMRKNIDDLFPNELDEGTLNEDNKS
jgi:hypothetical protein